MTPGTLFICFNWNAAVETSVTNVLGIFLNAHCNLLCVKEWSMEEYAFTEQYAPLPPELTCCYKPLLPHVLHSLYKSLNCLPE